MDVGCHDFHQFFHNLVDIIKIVRLRLRAWLRCWLRRFLRAWVFLFLLNQVNLPFDRFRWIHDFLILKVIGIGCIFCGRLRWLFPGFRALYRLFRTTLLSVVWIRRFALCNRRMVGFALRSIEAILRVVLVDRVLLIGLSVLMAWKFFGGSRSSGGLRQWLVYEIFWILTCITLVGVASRFLIHRLWIHRGYERFLVMRLTNTSCRNWFTYRFFLERNVLSDAIRNIWNIQILLLSWCRLLIWRRTFNISEVNLPILSFVTPRWLIYLPTGHARSIRLWPRTLFNSLTTCLYHHLSPLDFF